MTATVVAVGDIEVRSLPSDPDAPREDDAAVDTLWASAAEQSPLLFDGLVLCVVDVRLTPSGGVVTGRFERYRRVFAHLTHPDLCPDIRPVATSAVTTVQGGVLVGRRSLDVTEYPGRLELAPTGSIDLGDAADGRVDWRGALARELAEEVGVRIDPRAVRGLGLVHDTVHDVYDVIGGIELVEAPPEASPEYSWLGVVAPAALVLPDLVPTSKAALELAGLVG